MAFQHALLCLVLGLATGTMAQAAEMDDLYSAQTIVTGASEITRIPGLRECLKSVLVRVSGDQRLLGHPQVEEVLTRAGSLVRTFSYQDRLAGVPIHDEQGTYDRPHNLFCNYDHSVVDRVLNQLASQPWREPRPVVAVLMEVQRGRERFWLDRDDPRDQAMRESFALAASRMAMEVVFPSVEALAPPSPSFDDVATRAGADIPLSGTLIWNDAALGWIATWTLRDRGRTHCWEVQGVSFDEAFRVAMRGAAQILSGNGDP